MKRGFLVTKKSNRSIVNDTDVFVKIKIPSESLPSWDDLPVAPPNDETAPILFTRLPPSSIARPNDTFTECLLRSEVKDQILAIPGFPRPFTTPDPPRYKIKPVRGAGMGLFATTDIDVGDVIVVERPLLVSTQLVTSRGNSGFSYQQPSEVARMMIERMSETSSEEFYALHNCKGYTRSTINGLFDTNAIGIGALPGYRGECAAVCKVISRANHSCSPNAIWRFHVESFTTHLRAILPIKKGEQVFASYGGINLPRDQRQRHFLERYGFQCVCPTCTIHPRESDEARKVVQIATRVNKCEDDSALQSWVSDSTKPDDLILVECMTIIKILDDEKYYTDNVWAVWYQRLVKAYCALEDEENARKWAKKAAGLQRAFTLNDGGWEAVAKDPKKTDWWGLRAKTRSGVFLVKNLEELNVEKGFSSLNTLRSDEQIISTISGSRQR